MANLAIKGHTTRGKEVIELLEMLGGKNEYQVTAIRENRVYFVDEYQNINFLKINQLLPEHFIIFTLEEFLEKYPYKVGDKVQDLKYGEMFTIANMHWEEKDCTVYYLNPDIIQFYTVEELNKYNEPYKEETMEETNKAIFEGNAHCCDIMNDIIKDNIKERKYAELRMPLDDDDKLSTEVTIDGNKIFPPNNYLIGKVTQVDNGMLVEFVKKQPNYPKTYEECCKVFGLNHYLSLGWDSYDAYSGVIKYLPKLIEDVAEKLKSLSKLLICRDAYWKIAANEMGLEKSWEPDWTDSHQKKWTINFYQGEINLTNGPNVHFVLAFPTEEMRDVFYENFKDLIEECKELL